MLESAIDGYYFEYLPDVKGVTVLQGHKLTSANTVIEATDAAYSADPGGAPPGSLTVKYNGTELTKDTDYTAEYSNNDKVGEATVTITGKGDYVGTVTGTYNVTAKPIDAESVTVDPIADQTYEGTALTPEVTVKDGEYTLVKDTDYEVVYSDNEGAGTGKATITGIGIYGGSRDVTFTIIDPSVEAVEAMIAELPAPDEMVYTDIAAVEAAQKSYDALTDAQKAKVDPDLVTALQNASEKAADLAVEAMEAADVRDDAIVKLAQLDALVDADLYKADSYKTYSDARDAFKALAMDDNATAKALRNARSAVIKAYTNLEKKIDISSAKITGLKAVNYTGKAQTQDPVVTLDGATLTKGTEYKVSYKNNTNAGTATVVVTGTGDNHMGTATATFKINKIAQKMTATAKAKTVKVAKVGKAKQTVAPITVKNAQGAVTYKKAGGAKQLTVNAKTGKITVKKGTKKGTYKCTVKVTAKGNTNYNALTKTVKVTIKVKK